MCLGANSWIIILVMAAHVGCDGEKSRYLFSHMMSMASFLVMISRRSSLPLLIGQHSISQVILGKELSSHMNPLIILFSAISMWGGIPWAFARNCV